MGCNSSKKKNLLFIENTQVILFYINFVLVPHIARSPARALTCALELTASVIVAIVLICILVNVLGFRFWLSGYDSGSCLTWLHICSTLCLSSLFVALLNAYMRAHLIYRWIQSQSLEKWNIKKEIHTNCIRFFVLCILLLHLVCPFIEQVSLFINLYILLVCIVDMNICQIDSTTREKNMTFPQKLWAYFPSRLFAHDICERGRTSQHLANEFSSSRLSFVRKKRNTPSFGRKNLNEIKFWMS